MSPRNLLVAAVVCGVVLGAAAVDLGAWAQEHDRRMPEIVAPVDGATVANPVSVAFGFGPPGGGQSTDSPQGEEADHRRGGPHVFLVIDASPPDPDTTVQADPQHVPFPEGQRQVTVNLAPGRHQLRLVLVGREGKTSRRVHPGNMVTIVVR